MAGATFAEVRRRLEVELERRNGNTRALAREITSRGGVGLEQARRAIYRILRDGQAPTGATSEWLERGLGKKPGYFTVTRPDQAERRDRLAAVEAKVAELEEALRLAGEAHDAWRGRLEELEAAFHGGRGRRGSSSRGGGASK